MSNIVDKIDIESRLIKWIHQAHESGNIIIDNSFQRRYVWTDGDMIALIETILLGCPIPEIYLWQQETDADSGDTIYSVVDGQQRIGAVNKFLNDEFTLKRTSLDHPDSDYCGKKFSQLSQAQKSIIWKYKFSIRFIKESVTKEEISSLFLRLNRTNITLNPQELRNAEFNGKFIKLADQISSLKFWDKFQIFNAADIRRMRDLEFISTLLIFLRMGIEEDTNQSSINKAYDLFNEKYPQADADYKSVHNCLKILESLASRGKYTTNFLNKKTHLYTLFLFAYYILTLPKSKQDLDTIGKRLDLWFAAYENDAKLTTVNEKTLLERYRHLSQEGSKKKANRIERLEIIKMFCTNPKAKMPLASKKTTKKVAKIPR